MGERAAQERAAAIEGFAAVLRELRETAGTPSFRELAGRSRAISHTTLHEAAQGHRLPSWATTAEFVKACGADPADYRARWEQANRAVLDAEHGHAPQDEDVTAPVGDAATATAPPTTDETPPPTDETAATAHGDTPGARQSATPASRALWRRRPRALAGAGTALAAAAVVIAVLAASGSGGSPTPSTGPSTGVPQHPTAEDCPIYLPDPAPHRPLYPGDGSAYVGDLNYQDCTKVRPGVTIVKKWQLKNAGSVTWRGRSLHREDISPALAACGTPGIVAIRDTRPGQIVTLSVPITTPDHAAYCFASFKMYDSAGRLAFSGARPINFQLIVT